MAQKTLNFSAPVNNSIKRRNVVSEHKKYDFGHSELNLVVEVEESPVDDFYINERQPKNDRVKSKQFVNPLYVIFNQERLDELGEDTAKAWLDSLAPRAESELQQLRSKLSDEQLVTMIKSRYLQKPCEVAAWAKQMAADMESFNDEVSRVFGEIQAKQVQEQQTSSTVENVTE